MKKIFIILFLLAIFPISALADTHTAASCKNRSGNYDVQAAINAASDGDTVAIPGGLCIWDTGLTWSGKSLILSGAGVGVTNITSNVTNLGEGWIGSAIYIRDSSPTKTVRITNFSLANGMGSPAATGLIYLANSRASFQIDNMAFSGGGRGVYVAEDYYGVIRNNTFSQSGLIVERAGYDASWSTGVQRGTANAVYIEGNTISHSSELDLDCSNGGRIVYRWNTISGGAPSNHGLDSVNRGCLQLDVYNNTITQAGSYNYAGIQSRSGTSVIYNNIINGTFTGGAIFLQNYRSTTAHDAGTNDAYGYCDGDNTTYDGNTSPKSTYYGYPCGDQPGYGQGAFKSQVSYPIYEWNNCKTSLGCSDGGANDISPTVESSQYTQTHIVSGRDYFVNTQLSGYTAYDCPHPLTGLSGTCDSAIAGLSGYNVTGGGGDTSPPSVYISTSSQTITSDSLTVTGTASDDVGVTSCKYRIGTEPDGSNGTACTGTTSWSCSTSGYSSGANTLYVECGDAAGNWSTGRYITVTYNIPTYSFTGTLNGSIY
jgi:parallel beta-helix repeat protein